MTISPSQGLRPWYRHHWPWILIAGPLLVVLASIFTFWLAFKSSDGLVSEDYYRQGLAATQTLHRSDRAAALGITARVGLSADRIAIRIASPSPDFHAPSRLRVTVSHPTRAGLDQTRLMEGRGFEYEAAYRLPESGHWLILIEDEGATWRLLGKLALPMQGQAVIGGTSELDTRQKAAEP